MRFSKAALVKETRDVLFKFGYYEMKDKFTVADGLFAKELDNGLFLTLGFTISRLYEDRFTASYYLSRTTIWAALWGDVPKECYKRIGHYLSRAERKLLAPQENEEQSDVWWDFDAEAIARFLQAIQLTEDRFLNQDGLINQVNESSEVNRLHYLSKKVVEGYLSNRLPDRVLRFTPKKDKFIDVRWFELAEITLLDENEIVNKNTVSRLAADAYRQTYLMHLRSYS